jgi:hypothetical protein
MKTKLIPINPNRREKMRGTPTKKTHHPHTGVRHPFCPERFSPKARGLLPHRNLVDTGATNSGSRLRLHHLPTVAKKPLELTTKKKAKGSSRPENNVRIVPIFRKSLDLAKFGRAVIALAGQQTGGKS